MFWPFFLSRFSLTLSFVGVDGAAVPFLSYGVFVPSPAYWCLLQSDFIHLDGRPSSFQHREFTVFTDLWLPQEPSRRSVKIQASCPNWLVLFCSVRVFCLVFWLLLQWFWVGCFLLRVWFFLFFRVCGFFNIVFCFVFVLYSFFSVRTQKCIRE